MKKFLSILVCLMAVCLFSSNVIADEVALTEAPKTVNVYIFTKDGCPHCVEAKEFFAKLKEDKTYGDMFNLVAIQVYDSDWNADENNMAIMTDVAEKFGDEVSGVPYIVIGDSYSVNGYAASLDSEIKKAIEEAYEDEKYEDVVAPIAAKYADGLGEKVDDKKDDTGVIIAILAVVIASTGSLIYFSRKK